MQLRKGKKVQYKHGRGFSTGTVIAVDGDSVRLTTKNGTEVVRTLTSIKLANPEKAAEDNTVPPVTPKSEEE